MIIDTEKGSFEVDLYDGDAARKLSKNLPREISMSRWGDEFYGMLNSRVGCAGDSLRDVFEIGEVALWPDGNALCIFFGPTPASRGEEPRMIFPGVRNRKNKGRRDTFSGFRLISEERKTKEPLNNVSWRLTKVGYIKPCKSENCFIQSFPKALTC